MILTCPNCKEPVVDPKSVTPDSTPLDGDIFLCGSCGQVSIMSSRFLRQIMKEEFDRLSKEEKRDVSFAARNIIAVSKQPKSKLILPDWLK